MGKLRCIYNVTAITVLTASSLMVIVSNACFANQCINVLSHNDQLQSKNQTKFNLNPNDNSIDSFKLFFEAKKDPWAVRVVDEIRSKKIKSQTARFTSPLFKKDMMQIVGWKVELVLPDKETTLGRFAMALEKYSTQLVLADVMPNVGTAGFFDYLAKLNGKAANVICIDKRISDSEPEFFAEALRHEAMHAYLYYLKSKNQATIFMPFFLNTIHGDGYGAVLASEELITYAKEFARFSTGNDVARMVRSFENLIKQGELKQKTREETLKSIKIKVAKIQLPIQENIFIESHDRLNGIVKALTHALYEVNKVIAAGQADAVLNLGIRLDPDLNRFTVRFKNDLSESFPLIQSEPKKIAELYETFTERKTVIQSNINREIEPIQKRLNEHYKKYDQLQVEIEKIVENPNWDLDSEMRIKLSKLNSKKDEFMAKVQNGQKSIDRWNQQMKNDIDELSVYLFFDALKVDMIQSNRKLEQLVDQVRDQLKIAHQLFVKANDQGYFTAKEYLEFIDAVRLVSSLASKSLKQ